jgi:hypothetical protein
VLQRYRMADVGGSYPLVPPFLGYLDGSYRLATGVWNLTDGISADLALHGWAKPQHNGEQRWRWTIAKRATALLPILIPEPHRITIPMFANVAPGATQTVVVRCNGVLVAQTDLAAQWTNVSFDTDGRVGENEITIDALPLPYQVATAPAVAPVSSSPTALPNASPVAVAIGPATVALPH